MANAFKANQPSLVSISSGVELESDAADSLLGAEPRSTVFICCSSCRILPSSTHANCVSTRLKTFSTVINALLKRKPRTQFMSDVKQSHKKILLATSKIVDIYSDL